MTTAALGWGAAHAVVDCASGYLVFADVGYDLFERRHVVALVLLYNGLAFAGQALVGLFADRLRSYRPLAVAGAALAATALMAVPVGGLVAPWLGFRVHPLLGQAVGPGAVVLGVVLVGVGNACFHVGAGAHVLRVSGHRAAESGVFVGPGSLGLFTGIWAGFGGVPLRWAIVVALVVAAGVMARRRVIDAGWLTELPRVRRGVVGVAVVCGALLLVAEPVRSVGGGTVAGHWRGISTEVMLLLAVAACCGKMVGGFLGDRFGWGRVGVGALVLSAPLISVWVHVPVWAVVGMLLFQVTMAITLKATHHLLPMRPGLAFGLPCVFLYAGALPGLLGYGMALRSWPLVLGMGLGAAVTVGVALGLLRRTGASPGPAQGRSSTHSV